MNCLTCGHATRLLAEEGGGSVCWCPWCGTLTALGAASERHEAPVLVERCRRFHRALPDALHVAWLMERWRLLGVPEACLPAKARNL